MNRRLLSRERVLVRDVKIMLIKLGHVIRNSIWAVVTVYSVNAFHKTSGLFFSPTVFLTVLERRSEQSGQEQGQRATDQSGNCLAGLHHRFGYRCLCR